MSKKQKHLYTFGDYFLLRCPLYPIEDFLAIGDGLKSASLVLSNPDDSQLETRYIEDCRLVREGLEAIVARPTMDEALFMSSRTVVKAVNSWRKDPISKRGAAAERSLLKYATRAMTRATPYGLMAGVACGTIGGEQSRLEIAPRSKHRRHIRGDARTVMSLARLFANDPALRNAHRYCVNSTLYQTLSSYKYYESNSGWAYGKGLTLVVVARTKVLDTILGLNRGYVDWDGLVELVRSCDDSIMVEDAESFLEQLIGAQILIPDAYPCPTGSEMGGVLLQTIRKRSCGHSLESAAVALTSLTSELWDIPLGEGISHVARAEDILNEVTSGFMRTLGENGNRQGYEREGENFHKDEAENEDSVGRGGEDENQKREPKISSHEYFQVDLVLGMEAARLSQTDLKPLLNTLEALYRINSRNAQVPLQDFAETFRKRYADKWIPIMDALDPDTGIKFGDLGARQLEPSPLLRLPLGRTAGIKISPALGTEGWMSKLIYESARVGSEEIRLKSEDILSEFTEQEAVHPALAMQVLARCWRKKGVDGTEGNPDCWWQLQFSSGAHPIGITGRFAHVLGKEMQDNLRRDAVREQSLRRELLVEVNYLPPDRLANLCQHPSFRDFSIFFMCPPGNGSGGRIDMDDLLVSANGPYVRIMSRSLGVEVLPRVDHSLNTSHFLGTSMVHFLTALQYQNKLTNLQWNWGNLSKIPELPRVLIDGVEVSPRRWNLEPKLVNELTKGVGKQSMEKAGFAAFAKVQKWRSESNVPRYLGVGTTTANYLCVDLDNPLGVDLFLREIRSTPSTFEMTEIESGGAVAGKDGTYVTEVTLPIWLNGAKPHGEEIPPHERRIVHDLKIGRDSTSIRRVRTTNEGVCFFKIYAGEGYMDALLRNQIRSLVEGFSGKAGVDGWFFIRYADPETHIRLRFMGEPGVLRREVIPSVEEMLLLELQHREVTFQMAQYEPEFMRYGGPVGMNLSEQFFTADSAFVLDLLGCTTATRATGKDSKLIGAGNRWKVVVATCDHLLDAWGMDITSKLNFIENYRDQMSASYNIGKGEQSAIGKFFRHEGSSVTELLSRHKSGSYSGILKPAFKRNLPVIREIFERLRLRGRRGDLSRSGIEILQSYVHMHCNRMFITQQRRQETILLHMLARMYRTLKYRES